MSVLLETVGLKKYFQTAAGKLHAVDDINLKIGKGETLGVVGESGCGKSTLGRVILRLLEADAGQILFEGKDILKRTKAQMKDVRTQMQIIFQDPYSSLDPRISVIDLIREPMGVNKLYGGRAQTEQRALELMDKVGLARRLANAYPHELDGGRRQRIGVARALAVNPKFIVCDEPVSALDVSIQAQILNLLMDLQDELGLTYLFITHDLSVVRHISNEIMVMYLGQCIERGPSAEIFERPLHPYTRALLNAIPHPDLRMRSQKLQIIRGEVTNPIEPKPGCRFAARCDRCHEGCTAADPALREVSPGHFAACTLYDEGRDGT